MRIAFSRLALALACTSLAPACAAQSYVVLLKNPVDVENHVHITNSKGTFGINAPGYGTTLDKNVQTVHRYDPAQINADFADALEGMSKILAAGLPFLSHSYVALMELPTKPLGYLAYNPGDGNVLIEKPEQALIIDGYSDEPYMADRQQLMRDFGPALASLDEIIKAGFRPATYVVLLESPDGTVGKVSVTDSRGKVLIEEAGQAAGIGGGDFSEERLFKLQNEEIKQSFGNALESTPILPAKYVLLFKSGSTKIADESQEEADKMLEDIKNRPSPDVTIAGHADTVGKDALNDKLSHQRAEYIEEMIHNRGKELRAIYIEYYGEHKLLVQTPDNKAEIRNRRVEVTVR